MFFEIFRQKRWLSILILIMFLPIFGPVEEETLVLQGRSHNNNGNYRPVRSIPGPAESVLTIGRAQTADTAISGSVRRMPADATRQYAVAQADKSRQSRSGVSNAKALGSRKTVVPIKSHAASTLSTIRSEPGNAEATIEVIATGYYAGVESTGKRKGHPSYGITKSGVRVRRGTVSTIAADPSVFPIGTLLHIPGYGYGIVADTGSAIKGNKLDLYFETKQQVYSQWGKKRVKIIVLRKGNGKLTEAMMDQLNVALKKASYELPVISPE